jgi:undecaprenyl-diphosphatase
MTAPDRRAALLGALITAGVTTVVARRRLVHPFERSAFRAVNTLPSGLGAPVYVAMQAGSLPAVFVVAGAARVAGDRRLSTATAAVGTGVWAGCKVVKRWVRRGRPADTLDHPRIRGAAARGLGFPSGHAAVAAALTCLVAPALPAGARRGAWVLAGSVAGARMYVGAHLPLDVVGGAAFGLAAASATRIVLDRSP